MLQRLQCAAKVVRLDGLRGGLGRAVAHVEAGAGAGAVRGGVGGNGEVGADAAVYFEGVLAGEDGGRARIVGRRGRRGRRGRMGFMIAVYDARYLFGH